MATKKIQIEFDMNTNEVKLAGEATMSLAQQVRILQKELSKTPEGTKEFELLRNKLNDTKDNFERVNAKSRELFGTLSLIPGPIGEIAGKINGAISLLKVFSGFSLKDIQGQFNSLLNDIKQIGSNLLGLGETNKKLSDSTDTLTDSVDANKAANVGALVQLQNLTDAQKAAINPIQKQIDEIDNLISQQQKQLIATKDLEAATYDSLESKIASNNISEEEIQLLNNSSEAVIKQQNALSESIKKRAILVEELQASTTQTKANTTANQQNTSATKLNSVAVSLQDKATKQAAAGNLFYATTLRLVATAANAASTAVRLFKAVLISLGIGALIVAFTELVTQVYEYVSGTSEAERVTKQFNDELERQNELLDLDKAALKRSGDERLAQLKSQGASERGLRKEQLNQRQSDLQLALRAEREAADLYNRSLGQVDEQTRKTLGDNLIKRQQQVKDAQSQLRVQRLENIAQERKENQEQEKERAQKEKEKLEERKKELDAQIQLEINSKNTQGDKLKKLLEDRLAIELQLEKKSASELQLIREENQKQIRDALKDDFEEKRKKKLADYEALIEIEQNQADLDTERLILLLQKKRDIELQELELTEEQKKAIISKYEADFRKLRQDAREKQLVEDIEANRGNFDKQIELYRQFGKDVIDSKNYTEAEKLRIQEEVIKKIEELEKQRFENEKNKLDLKLQDDELTYTQYFDKLDLLYQAELERVEKQYKDKEIIEAEYNRKVKELTDARNNIRQQELEAQIKLFQALGDGLNAVSQIVGEQTKQGKALAVAASLINTYAAIAGQLKTFSGIGAPPIPGYAIAQAIATGLVGFAQVRKILATQVPSTTKSSAQFSGGIINVNERRAQGGMIVGPGGETSDSIPALLSDGEYIVNARSTRMFRPLLETINTAANLPQFAVGGLVRESKGMTPMKSDNETLTDAISSAFGQTPIRTYVTANEVSNQQQFERIIKSRSLI